MKIKNRREFKKKKKKNRPLIVEIFKEEVLKKIKT